MPADGYPAASTPGTPPSGGLPLALYADFERKRGGLLHALQGLLLPAQMVILSRAPLGLWWSPAVLMPLYLAYFAVRDPIWLRLYRRHGHLESAETVREARRGVWYVLALTVILTTLNIHFRHFVSEVSWPAAVLWIVAFWLPVVLWGKLPVDWFQFYMTWALLDLLFRMNNNPSGLMPWIWLIPAFPVAVGVTQHVLFVRSVTQRGGANHA